MPGPFSDRLNIQNVPSVQPFVEVLAAHLLQTYGEAPDVLARVLVLVPTRRAVVSLRDTLLRCSKGKPLLLPRIQPLGDIDVELAMPEVLWAEQSHLRPELPPAISPRQRVFELARLIEAFQNANGQSVSADQSVRMALALGDLIDDMAREEVPYERLERLVEGDLASHWQKTLAFLRIITEHWPMRLQEMNRIDAVERRSRVLRLLADHWEAVPPDFPVVAAGTTGSIPATARLLDVIARLPQGRIILPGLDQHSDDETCDAVRRAVSHPQYGLLQLLERMGCSRQTVIPLDLPEIAAVPEPRAEFLRAMMVPAELSHRWRAMSMQPEMLDGLTLVECEDEAEESQIIALMLRQALEAPDTKAMLVTHDRALARRVALLLRRYHLEVEDGGGYPLLATPVAVFAMLLLRAAEEQAPADVLALLKHPLCRLGVSAEMKSSAICQIELTLYRGICEAQTLSAQCEVLVSKGKVSADVLDVFSRLVSAIQPLLDLFAKPRAALPAMLSALVGAMEHLAAPAESPAEHRLWSGQDGHLLSSELADIHDHSAHLGEIEPGAFAALLATLLSRQSVQPIHHGHPRLTILSPMDARMQPADLVILAGLNEGCWPPAAQSDPWMSRAMREMIGLQPYERQIGQAAHDFSALCHAPRVMLTRARKVGGRHTLASRWWLRLHTVLETFPREVRQRITLESQQWRWWAEQFRATEHRDAITRPAPVPPLEARPRTISVSQVEKLIRDPYAFYARYILRLRPLDPIDKEPSELEFGNAVHKALELFVSRYPHTLPDHAEAELSVMLDTSFAEILRKVQAPTFWRRRMKAIVEEVLAAEHERRNTVQVIECEKKVETLLELPGGPFTVKARMDRVEHHLDGMVNIVDYKTGTVPSLKTVHAGYSPQLTLEGWLLEVSGYRVGDLVYWKIPAGKNSPAFTHVGKSSAEYTQLIDDARQGLLRLLTYFDQAETAYPCLADRPDAPKHNDYVHLQRLEEWQ